jgi:hypothetical protein
MVAHRYPTALVMGPARKQPMKAPTGPLHWNADCHEASMIYSLPVWLYTPKSFWNRAVAMNCPMRKTQYDSMIYRSVRESLCPWWAGAYNGARHDECPPTGSGIGLDSLEHGHVMFDIFGIDGARPVVDGLLGANILIDGFMFGGGMRLDLRHGRLLVDLVVHVDEFCDWGNARNDERRKGERQRLGNRVFIPATARS